MNPISFSKMELVATCPAAAVIPWVDDVVDPLNGEDPTEDPRHTGKVAHRFLELVSGFRGEGAELDDARTRALALLDSDDDRAIAAVLDLERLPVDLRAEVAFAWDWRARRGRLLGVGLDRRYELRPGEIPGTTDVLGVDLEASVVNVGDYKRGITRYPRPGKFLQTLLGGMAAASHFGAETAVLDLVYLSDDGQSYPVRDEVDAWDLERAGERVERALARAEELEPIAAAGLPLPLVTGRHCRYCPARKNCNATTALVRSLPERFDALAAEGRWNDLTLDQRARRYHLVTGLKRLLDEAMAEIYADAAATPGGIDLGDGTILRLEPYEREKLAGDVAYRTFADMFGAERAERASRRTMAKDAARAEIAQALKKGEKISTKKGDGLFDRFLREVRAKNGTTIERGETVRPVKIKTRKDD